MDRFGERTGRHYGLVEYAGHRRRRVVVADGVGVGAAEEAVEALVAAGEPVGLVKVRLYRPFPAEQLVAALPLTVRSIAVLDRTKEPGALGEPLYLDVVAALDEACDREPAPFAERPRVSGGRWAGVEGADPAMVKAVLDELAATGRSGTSRWASTTT